MTRILFPATLLALAATAALAQTPATVPDADGNGTLSLTELRAVYPALTDEGFASMDANGDAEIDAAELKAAIADGMLADGTE